MSEVDQAYLDNLKVQIEEKKALLTATRKELQKVREHQLQQAAKQGHDTTNDPRYDTVALYETLKRIPYQPARKDLINISLAHTKWSEQTASLRATQADVKASNAQLSNDIAKDELLFGLYEEIGEHMDNEIDTREKLKHDLVNSSLESRYNRLMESTERLQDRTGKLVDYVQQLVHDYVLEEVEIESDEEPEVLSLLEALVNSAVTGSGNVELENIDDPFVRYLLVNRIVESDPKDANQIRLCF